MLEKFAAVKNAGLLKRPMMKSTMIAGTSASSRKDPSEEAPCRARHHLRPLFDRRVGHATTSSPSAAAISSCRSHGAVAELFHDPAPPHDEHARADPQLVEVVGDEEHGGPVLPRTVDDAEQGLLRGDVDSDRWADDDEERRVHRQRAADDDLLLIAAAQLGQRLVAAAGHDLQALDDAVRRTPASACSRRSPSGRDARRSTA